MAASPLKLFVPRWSIWHNHVLDAVPDVPDVRDQVFVPSLQPLQPRLVPFKGEQPGWWNSGRVRDQGHEPSCVGHALAAVIDHMRAAALVRASAVSASSMSTLDRPWVSATMLYYMARFHDEWAGEDYAGSSVRGGLKGFFYNGVCANKDVERVFAARSESTEIGTNATWYMTKRLAEGARTIQLGAYYRVRPRLADMHAALNEANAVVVSANTHDGWFRVSRSEPTISFKPGAKRSSKRHGMHAFAVIGYDDRGFWVQNSWGTGWGENGFAHWKYEDWAENVVDAWVLRLAILTPDGNQGPWATRLAAYGSRIDRTETHFLGRAQSEASGPSRLDVLGHLVPFRDGKLDLYGPYNVNRQTLRETFQLIRQRYADGQSPNGEPYAPEGVTLLPHQRRYRHVLIYFLGGWANEAQLANELASIIPVFIRLGIYPFFVSWDTPMFHELDRLVRSAIDHVAAQTNATPASHRVVRDRLIEGRIAIPGNRMLRDLRGSARRIFVQDQPDPDFPATLPTPGEGAHCLDRLFDALGPFYRDGSLSYHLVAHGFGAQVLVECLAQQECIGSLADISSCTLISPLVASHRVGHMDRTHAPSLFESLRSTGVGSRRRRRPEYISIERLRLIGFSEQAMRTDRFSDNYGRAWPELWSYVMGLDQLARSERKTVDQFYDKHSGMGRRHLPLLALPSEIGALVAAGERVGHDISAQYVVSSEDDADASLHHELGFHEVVLDGLASEILGRDCGGTFASGGRRVRLLNAPN